MSLIYSLNSPLDGGRDTPVNFINVFRIDMETYRSDPLFPPHMRLWMAACDETGHEILKYDPTGENKPVVPSYFHRSFDDISPRVRAAHKALMQAILDDMIDRRELPDGRVIDV